MELRKTEEAIDELSIRYESIRRSPIILDYFECKKPSSSSSSSSSLTTNKNNDVSTDMLFPEIIIIPSSSSSSAAAQGDGGGTVDVNVNVKNDMIVIPKLINLSQVYDCITILQSSLLEIQPKILKFQQRLQEKDPITGNSRYGEKTKYRVQSVVDKYLIMKNHIIGIVPPPVPSSAGDDDDETNNDNDNKGDNNNAATSTSTSASTSTEAANSIIKQIVDTYIKQQQIDEQIQYEKQQQEQKQKEEERIANEIEYQRQQLLFQEQQRQQQLQQEQQNAILHEQANIVREQRRQQQQLQQDWIDSIVKGPEGVKQQLIVLKQSCNCQDDDPIRYQIAISSLQQIFQQINSHPEEVKFRRIRRNHEQFINDIGKYKGGIELLIASGFELGEIDDIPVYLSREPNIEKDMDGWSNWFDLLKSTLDILNKEVESLS